MKMKNKNFIIKILCLFSFFNCYSQTNIYAEKETLSKIKFNQGENQLIFYCDGETVSYPSGPFINQDGDLIFYNSSKNCGVFSKKVFSVKPNSYFKFYENITGGQNINGFTLNCNKKSIEHFSNGKLIPLEYSDNIHIDKK